VRYDLRVQIDASGSTSDFKVTLKIAARINMESMMRYINGTATSFLPYECLQVV
jgi:hypothetical protein